MESLKKIWQNINKKINVVLTLAIIFILIDVYLLMGIFDTYSNRENYEKILHPRPIELKKIEIEPHEAFDIAQEIQIPEEYQIIIKNNIYINPELQAKREAAKKLEEEKKKDNKKEQKKKIVEQVQEEDDDGLISLPTELPPLEGYTIKGIVYGKANTPGAVFIQGPTGESYYGKEGRRLVGTSILVKKVYKDSVLLSRPGYKDTLINFSAEEFLSRWKRGETIDPFKIDTAAQQMKSNSSDMAVGAEKTETNEADDEE